MAFFGSQKILSCLLAVTLHVVIFFLLLRDHISLPIEHVGQSVVVQLLQEKNDQPVRLTPTIQKLAALPPRIEVPQLEVPLGKTIPVQPMVVIDAQFSPEVAQVIPISEYIGPMAEGGNIYRAEVVTQISDTGAVDDVYIERSNGNQSLDEFIISYAKAHWHFIASKNDGVPVMSWKTIAVEVNTKEMIVRR